MEVVMFFDQKKSSEITKAFLAKNKEKEIALIEKMYKKVG